MIKAELIEYVGGLGDVYRTYAPFDKQLQALRQEGIKAPVSVRDGSYIRLHGGTQEDTRTCHAPICAKDSPVIIARASPLILNLRMARQAVEAHRNNQYPVFDNDKHIYGKWEKIAKEDAGKKPEERRAMVLGKREDYRIHRDSDEARFFWQDTREDYFKQKVSGDIVLARQISINDVDSANGTIINYVEFVRPVFGSLLAFGGRVLSVGGRALGVREASAEGAKPAKIFGYELTKSTKRQAEEYLKILRAVRAGEMPASRLERVIKALEK